jgi:hypothetical protein
MSYDQYRQDVAWCPTCGKMAAIEVKQCACGGDTELRAVVPVLAFDRAIVALKQIETGVGATAIEADGGVSHDRSVAPRIANMALMDLLVRDWPAEPERRETSNA